MSRVIDARGKACPTPVILGKKALEEENSPLTVLVDNPTAVQNLTRLGEKMGKEIGVVERDGYFEVRFSGGNTSQSTAVNIPLKACSTGGCGYAVFVGRETVGSGAEELGRNLMKMFLYTLSQGDDVPASLLFMNGGVKLPTGEEEQVIESLRTLAERGCQILVCGTCLNYYGIADQLKVGTVSNMYDIVSAMQQAAKVITV